MNFNYPNGLDIGIILGFIMVSILIGVVMAKWGQKSTKDYFTSGGKAPWWLLGTSMVATTFAADTPLTLSGWVVTRGISQNWFWWCQVPITMAGVFFFAALWKRANLLTDQELVYRRYSGKSADFLRGFKALYLSLMYYTIVMGWVNKAMARIVTLCFPNIPKVPVVDGIVKFLYLHTPLSKALQPEVKDAFQAGTVDPDQYVTLLKEYCTANGLQFQSLLSGFKNMLSQELDPAIMVKQLQLQGFIDSLQMPSLDALQGASPMLFMAQCLDVASGVNEYKILFALFVITISYTAISGLWGVLVTDFLQFWVAMAGCIILAVLAVNAAAGNPGLHLTGFMGSMDTLMERMGDIYSPEKAKAMVAIIPPRSSEGLNLTPFSYLLVFITLAWWSLGFTDGGSYLAQRMLSAKNEKHAALGYLWYGVAHYAVRMWPWIIVGFAAAVLFPHIPNDITGYVPTVQDAEVGYVKVMLTVLPHGLLGLLLASFMAAYMSTISTQVCLSASYLINDFYRPYIVKHKEEKHYVRVSVGINVFIAMLGIVFSLFISSIESGWFLLASINGGIGVIYILRWYWHRVNAWTEVSCIFTLIIMAIIFKICEATIPTFAGVPYPINLLINVPISVGVAMLVTMITKPVDKEKLKQFVRSVQPGGPGWKAIEDEIKEEDPNFVQNSPLTKRHFISWILATITIYLFLFGIGMSFVGGINFDGWLGEHRRVIGVIFLICSIFTGWQVAESFSAKHWKETESSE